MVFRGFLHRQGRLVRAFGLVVVVPGLLWLSLLPGIVRAQAQSGITSPAPGSAISGDVPIFGSATIDPFQKYELHFKQDPSGDDAFIYFAGGTSPIVGGQLGVWQAGGLPTGAYTLRLRVVKADGNYAEYFIPNLSVNQGFAQTPTPSPDESTTETPTPTLTYTPAPQPTPALGQVAQPQVEGDPPTPTPGQVAVVDPGQTPALEGVLPTPTPANIAPVATPAGSAVTRELGEALSFQRLSTQFFNGIRISAALLIGVAAIVFGKRIFEWVWRRYS
jgi:hypothetical protein